MAKLNDSPSLDAICAKLKDGHTPEPINEVTKSPTPNGEALDHQKSSPSPLEQPFFSRPSVLRIPKPGLNNQDTKDQELPSSETLQMDYSTKRPSFSHSYDSTFNMTSKASSSSFQGGGLITNLSNSEGMTSVGRKNRRKNTAPKNLHQLRDSSEMIDKTSHRFKESEDILYNNNSKDNGLVDEDDKTMVVASMIDSETEDENFLRQADLTKSKGSDHDLLDSGLGCSYDGVLDLSCSNPRTAEFHVDDCGALDLSSGKSVVGSGNQSLSTNSYIGNNSKADGMDSRSSARITGDMVSNSLTRKEKNKSLLRYHEEKMQGSGRSSRDCPRTIGGCLKLADGPSFEQDHADANVMKEYAQSTVTELLSKLYGYGEDAATFAGNLPLQRFATGNILNTCEEEQEIEERLKTRDRMKLGGGVMKDIEEDDALILMHGNGVEVPEVSSERYQMVEYPRERNETPSQLDDQTESLGNQSEGSSEGNSAAAKVGALYSPLKGSSLPDYGKYVRRYQSSEDCGNVQCAELQYREHFHCVECTYKVFLKKEEMIRHFKWHRKRDESLQHGFLRYSPIDDCSKRFSGCVHNGRQTHYHCIQSGCSKVYISTSDVQMHSNYHRKDSAIIQLGFQRFRATEDCNITGCPFYGQRTTHFHCRKPGCNFSFKNKADIEKHKTYHQKDEILAKDGFKKFMKYETCHYQGCRFSNLANHIHCIRPGCDYVLHSTSQLLSHKRKHERREIEFAYRRFKDTNSTHGAMLNPALLGFTSNGQQQSKDKSNSEEFERRSNSPTLNDLSDSNSLDAESFSKSSGTTFNQFEKFDSELGPFARSLPSQPVGGLDLGAKMEEERLATSLGDSLNSASTTGESPVDSEDPDGRSDSPQNSSTKVSPPVNEKRERDETWKRFITRYTANDPCNSRCQLLYKDHYHCNSSSCGVLFKSKDGVREHARHHEQLERITELSYMTYQAGTSCVAGCQFNQQKHYHCLWTECHHVISDTEPVFRRLEHFHIHELSRTSGKRLGLSVVKSNQDLKRKRGRPPKYPKVDIPVVPKIEMSEENIAAEVERYGTNHPIAFGYKKFIAGTPCPDDKCVYFSKEHYHCVRKRCHHATDNKDVLNLHAKDFHSYITIQPGFEFFDRTVNCRRPHCHNNKANRHFHCVRSKCDYSFVRYSTMTQHDKKHKMAEMGLTPHPNIGIPSASIVTQAMSASATVTGSEGNATSSVLFGPTANSLMLQTSNSVRRSHEVTRPSISGQRLIAPKPVLSVPQVIVGVPVPSSASQGPAINVSKTLFSSNQSINPIVIQPINTQVKPVSSIAPPPHLVISQQNDSPTSESLPLAGLLQQRGSTLTPQVNWETMLEKMHFDVDQSCNHPFCKLKKKDHYHCIDCNQAFSDTVRIRNHMAKHGLKLDSNNKLVGWRYVPQMQNFGGSGHVDSLAKSSEKVDVQSDGDSDMNNNYEEEEDDDDDDDDLDASSSLNLNPMVFTDMLQRSQNKALEDDDSADLVMDLSESINSDKSGQGQAGSQKKDQEGMKWPNVTKDSNLFSDYGSTKTGAFHSVTKDKKEIISSEGEVPDVRRSARKRSVTALNKGSNMLNDGGGDSLQVKTPKLSSNVGNTDQKIQGVGEHQILEGYQLYAAETDCGVPYCGYKTNTTHYHCTKINCNFGSNEISALEQHSEYHRRTEMILGDDFTMFRVSQRCDSAMSCEYSGISTHYHCCKCPFVCTDLSKVTSHRKYHNKMEQIETQGFCKVAVSEDCSNDKCLYRGKQTHYHCMQGDCVFVATGPQQMLVHNKSSHGTKSTQ